MLTNTQDQLLIGAILGDSHVERNGSNCRVRGVFLFLKNNTVRDKENMFTGNRRCYFLTLEK